LKKKRNKRWEEVVTYQAMNSFEGGMVSDLQDPASNTVTNALNMELITVGKPVYFSKYKRAEARIRSSRFI
jgi:hypothetical protein